MSGFTPAITLTRAMTDPNLFGKVFAAPSFWTWRTVGKLLDGLPLVERREIELFEQCTGRSRLPNGPVRRIILLCGRRAGKDRFELSRVGVAGSTLCRLAEVYERRRAAGGADARRRQTAGIDPAPILSRASSGTVASARNFASD